jgi:hypothetical protein
LDLPKTLSMGLCAVRYESTRTVLITNNGNRAAKYTTSVKGPFRVEPREGYIGARKNFQMDVIFHPSVCPMNIDKFIDWLI